MGLKKIGSRLPAILAVLIVGYALPARAEEVAQLFGGMGMSDLEAARDSFFQSADSDGDFALSDDEQWSAMGAANSHLFQCWDEDGDGVCSYSEFLESGQRVFNELDVNGDGRLSPEEVQ